MKLLVVDEMFVSVGSGNFDNRSIQLNDEAKLDVLDRDFATQQTQLFELDRNPSQKMRLDKTGGRHLFERAADLASPEL